MSVHVYLEPEFNRKCVWRKIFSHHIDGGVFTDLEEAKKKNIHDENAKLFSILYDLESMRDEDGLFHLKLCYPTMIDEPFPCNEWKQSSNPVVESTVMGFVKIHLTWPEGPFDGEFGGLMKSSPWKNLMDDNPVEEQHWNSIGALALHNGKIPGPKPIIVSKSELYVFTHYTK